LYPLLKRKKIQVLTLLKRKKIQLLKKMIGDLVLRSYDATCKPHANSAIWLVIRGSLG
jgi:hypothetical protein